MKQKRIHLFYLLFFLYRSITLLFFNIERLERRLAGWKKLYLSRVLFSLTTYFLSLLHFLISMSCCLEKLQRNFLWGDLDNAFKFHLVNQKTMCESIQLGWLIIRSLAHFNQALFGEWLWHYATENKALWHTIIASKYGTGWGGWVELKGAIEKLLELNNYWKIIRALAHHVRRWSTT